MGERRPRKRSFTVHLSEELIERIRNAVYWTPGLTMSGLAEISLEKALADLEEKNGGRFRPRRGEIKSGRPVE